MARNKRFTDRHKFGNGDAGRHITDAAQRHQFRLARAWEHHHTLGGWCLARGVRLKIANNKHHWQFTRGETLVEWWPSSAKMVFQKLFREAVHVHTAADVLQILNVVFPNGHEIQIVGRK